VARKKATTGSLVVRAVIALAAIGVIVFAVQGGEWSTLNLLRQKTRLALIKHEVDSLNHEVDSLKKYKQALLTDPVMQEKIAREEFGMVKGNKEILYRYTEPDAGSRKPDNDSRKPEAGGRKP
jgi:cell division protein FtsB